MTNVEILQEQVEKRVEAEIVTLNGQKNGQTPLLAEKKSPKTSDYLAALQSLGYVFKLNSLDDSVEVNGEHISDALGSKIRSEIRDLGFKNMGALEDAYITGAYQNRYNPIADYLNELQWDGTERIDTLIDHFTDNTAVKDHPAPLFGLWFKKWAVGACAKVFEGHQNPMLILASRIRRDAKGERIEGQGIGKSYFTEWLCSGLPGYFLSSEIQPHDKDYKKRTLTHFIWEVDEFSSTSRRSDVDALKAFITMPLVTMRPSYGRNDIKKRPVANFIGTVNFDGVGFLLDTTGSRRFLTVEIIRINHDYTSMDVNQIWAEIMHLYRTGFNYNLSAEEVAKRNESNQNFERAGVYDDKILARYVVTHNPADVVNTDEITYHLLEIEKVKDTERSLQMEIARLLTREGLINRKRPSRWYGLRRK